MATRRIEHVDLPYAGKRYTPDNSRLAALYIRGGETLADIAIRKGENTARGLSSIAGLYSGYRAEKRDTANREQAMATRASEREAERLEREAERKAAADQRAADKAERTAERAGDQAIRAAERGEATTIGAVNATRPGVVNPALYEQVKRMAPGMAARFQVLDGAPVLMRTPEQERQAGVDAATAADRTAAAEDRKADNIRADRQLAATIAAGRNRTPDSGPLVAVMGNDGKPTYVTRENAIGKTPASGTAKPASGLEKRALNFFNRAEQADHDLEALESEIQKLGLLAQGRMAIAPNFLQSQQGQLYNQAQRAFTEARLRKDSGAAIPDAEFANDRRTYFAQPGDTVETLEQKRRGRAAVLASLGNESGQALAEFVGGSEDANSIVQSYRVRAARPGNVPAPGAPPAAPPKILSIVPVPQ